MRKIFQILEKLEENKIFFCFQNQSGKFYNLAVRDVYKKEHNLHSCKLEDIEENLSLMWGSLLDVPKTDNNHKVCDKMSSPMSFPAPPKG